MTVEGFPVGLDTRYRLLERLALIGWKFALATGRVSAAIELGCTLFYVGNLITQIGDTFAPYFPIKPGIEAEQACSEKQGNTEQAGATWLKVNGRVTPHG